MSSLWTPDGEHRVAAETASPTSTAPPDAPEEEVVELSEEDVALRVEFQELERDLLQAPVEEVIANHCYGLFQLAALHLGQQPPNLDKARVAIDALGAIVETLGDRLGEQTQTFTDGLAQLRLAYVQLYGAVREGGAGGVDPEQSTQS